jgi:hypothetical protein
MGATIANTLPVPGTCLQKIFVNSWITYITIMGDNDLPVPAQLETQLAKCKTVRNAAEYYKSREKSKKV